MVRVLGLGEAFLAGFRVSWAHFLETSGLEFRWCKSQIWGLSFRSFGAGLGIKGLGLSLGQTDLKPQLAFP